MNVPAFVCFSHDFRNREFFVRKKDGSNALVAGPRRSDGARPIFHSADPVLVEHMTFRLRAEVGFGVRA